MYRTPAELLTGRLRSVRERYDALAADVEDVCSAPIADPALSQSLSVVLAAEARRLDNEIWNEWLAWCAEETMVWVPLSTRKPHPAADQSLFLDDRRRLEERVWRFTDPNAWAVVPFGRTTRGVAGVEAWRAATGEILCSSALSLHHVRSGKVYATAGRQIHRLRANPDRADGPPYTLVHKILLLPDLEAGSPHLGWLL
jgi:3-phenylpropionate/cinnamic acid dioxygenase small subunit